MDAGEGRKHSTRSLDEPPAEPLYDTDAHLTLGTPVPDDPELLLGDVEAARSALGLPDRPAEPDGADARASRWRRATRAAGRARTAGLAKLGRAAGRPSGIRPYHPETAAEPFPEDDEAWAPARVPYLLVAGLAAGGLVAVVVLRRRRG
ncbi:hypothetical protein ACFV4M_30265 [Kitasatospora indigofera]|uniref:hypothetical protein n=1 Tax=Kitasatospora indigofera TaxID=67307 RepID=UPI0036539FFD